MMNLELLFKAASAAPSSFRSIAENHANTTSKYHLRDDGIPRLIRMYERLLKARRLFFSRGGL
jgi:hypothetical protein